MKLKIKDLPADTKTMPILHHSKINIKATTWDTIEKRFSTVRYPWFESTLWSMVKACLADDGVGLAAPQVGIFKRLFIIRDMDDQGNLQDTFSMFFNPTYVALTEQGKTTDVEGCLSVPGASYEVARWNVIEATWWDFDEQTGSPVKRTEKFSGFKARVFQHENQHLNAVSLVNVGKPVTKKRS